MIALLIGSIALGMSAPMITKQVKQNNFSDAQVRITNDSIESIRNEVNILREEMSSSIPSGMVAFFAANSCPEGWAEINSSWQGRFPRFAGANYIKDYDKINKAFKDTGVIESLNVGLLQDDAIRNITGSGPAFLTYGNNYYVNWSYLTEDAFYKELSPKNETAGAGNLGNSRKTNILKFDANRSVPTSTENRPKAVALLGCQKK